MIRYIPIILMLTLCGCDDDRAPEAQHPEAPAQAAKAPASEAKAKPSSGVPDNVLRAFDRALFKINDQWSGRGKVSGSIRIVIKDLPGSYKALSYPGRKLIEVDPSATGWSSDNLYKLMHHELGHFMCGCTGHPDTIIGLNADALIPWWESQR